MAPGTLPDQQMFDDALAVAPAAIRNGAELLPRRKPGVPQRCRLCSGQTVLTREHVPPRAAGNKLTSRAHTITDWHQRDGFGQLPGGRLEQGGIFGYTLCGPCNNSTGLPSRGLSTEYAAWAVRVQGILQDDAHVGTLNQRTSSAAFRVRLKAVRPGAFVRQVLSMIFTASGEWGLADLYPDLAASVRDGRTVRFPQDLWLGVALCAGPQALLAGPGLSVDLVDRSWRWLCVVAYPPYAFELTLAASDTGLKSELCGIGDFVEVPESAIYDVELDLMVTFTHSPLHGDWRTQEQIRSGLNTDGSHRSP